ncbi:MAG: hypothetical protein WC518_01875 [Patescibacteria group bacterium]
MIKRTVVGRLFRDSGAFGQLTPPPGLEGTIGDPDWDFFSKLPPRFDFLELCDRVGHAFEMSESPISPSDWEDQFESQKERLLALSGCSDGHGIVLLPGLLPVAPGDCIRKSLFNVYIPAVERGYGAIYPKRAFEDWCDGRADSVAAFPGVGHEHLIHLASKGLVAVFVYIAHCMRAWPVSTQRRLPRKLFKSNFSLAGGCDTLSVLSLHPDILAAGFCSPTIELSALQTDSPRLSICVVPEDKRLRLDIWGNPDDFAPEASGGLSFWKEQPVF